MKKFFLKTAIFSLSLGALQTVHALCSSNLGFSTVDIPMNVGRVVVRPSDAVGKVLHKAMFPITPNGSQYYCDANGSTFNATLSKNNPISSVGNSVYSTNIPGIGIRLYREAQTANYFSGYYPYIRNTATNTNYVLDIGYFVVEIIKTATATGSGAFEPGRYSAYGSRDTLVPWLTSTVNGHAITIASSSCEIQGNANRVINLAPVTKADFKGIGSTAAEQAFDMTILCNGGENTSGYEEKNIISLSYGFTPEGTAQDVIKNIAPNNVKAQGVSTQLILNGFNRQVVKNNDKILLGTVSSNQTIQYQVPMSARYYQSATTVTAGKVTGLATMTIQYD